METSVKAFMEASVEVVSVEVASVEASVQAFVKAFVEVTSVEASVEAFMDASVEAFMDASVEAFMEASTAWKRGSLHGSDGSFHGSFHKLPPKMQIVQVARLPVLHACV